MSELVKRKINKRDATKLTKLIRSTIDELETLILQAIEGQAWLSMGYETAEEWWREEIGPRRLGGESRDAVILQIASEQENKPSAYRASQKEIGELVGVPQRTVSDVVTRSSTERNHSDVDLENSDIVDAEIVDDRPRNLSDDVRKWREQFPARAELKSTPEDAAKWIPEFIESINADLDNITDWQELSSPETKELLREELSILRDKIARIEEKL